MLRELGWLSLFIHGPLVIGWSSERDAEGQLTRSHSVNDAENRAVPLDVVDERQEDLWQRVERYHKEYAKTRHMPRQARLKMVARMQEQAQQYYLTPLDGAMAVVFGLQYVERAGADTRLPFRQESNFLYLTGYDRPGLSQSRQECNARNMCNTVAFIGLDAYAPDESRSRAGYCMLFVPRIDATWESNEETLDSLKAKYDVDEVFWIDQLYSVSEEFCPNRLLWLPEQRGLVSSLVNHQISFGANCSAWSIWQASWQEAQSLLYAIGFARYVKTSDELDFIRLAVDITLLAHEVTMRSVRCGEWRSSAEGVFRYIGNYFRTRFQSFEPVFMAGEDTSIMHYYGEDQRIPDGSLVLVDAAAELDVTTWMAGGYTSDVARAWPCNGTFSPAQKAAYDIARVANEVCIKHCVPGATIEYLSNLSFISIGYGLLDIGVLRPEVRNLSNETLINIVSTVFSQHVSGHSVGMDVHDFDGYFLQPGVVLTCEPGLYFNRAELDRAYADATMSKYINRELVESTFVHVGGMRVEDMVLVHPEGRSPEVLSGKLAKRTEDIEELMRTGRFLPGLSRTPADEAPSRRRRSSSSAGLKLYSTTDAFSGTTSGPQLDAPRVHAATLRYWILGLVAFMVVMAVLACFAQRRDLAYAAEQEPPKAVELTMSESYPTRPANSADGAP